MTPTIFANGIWKSGNNLLIKACNLLGYPQAEFGVATSLLIGDRYAMRRLARGPRWEPSPVGVGIDMSTNVSAKWLEGKLSGYPSQCIGGHAAYSDRLLTMLERLDIRPIFIVRDPRDVISSFAHWIEKRPDYYAYPAFAPLPIEERMKAVIAGTQWRTLHFESFATVLDRSYGWLTRPSRVLTIRFEDLVGSKGGGDTDAQHDAIVRIANWIGASDVNIPEIADQLFGGTKTFRKGRLGSWKEEFTPAVSEMFTATVGDRLAHWGYGDE